MSSFKLLFDITELRNDAEDNSYMTWDLKYGEFDNDKFTVDYAASAPRANMLKGGQLLQFSNLIPYQLSSVY